MIDAEGRTLPSVLLLGGASTLAREMALCFAARGYAVALAGRDTAELNVIAGDIHTRHARPVFVLPFDALDGDGHAGFAEKCRETLGELPEGVVACFGLLPDQAEAQRDAALARRCLDTNYAGAVSVLERFAAEFEQRRRGFIAGGRSCARLELAETRQGRGVGEVAVEIRPGCGAGRCEGRRRRVRRSFRGGQTVHHGVDADVQGWQAGHSGRTPSAGPSGQELCGRPAP